MKFEELNISKQLLKAVADIGFTAPTPIQEKSFPVVMSGKDVVGIAQTGTGKTFAYLLPVLRMLSYSEQRAPRVLIVVPTRELVVQVVGEIQKATKYMSVRVAGVYGGGNINIQKQTVYDGLDIVVGTPGRVMDLYLSRTLAFHSIQRFVIDEMDEMLNLGFRPQLMNILDVLPQKRQNILYSATLDEEVEKILNLYFKTPQFVELVSRGTPLEKIKQFAYEVPNFNTKANLLEYLLQQNDELKKVLVFVKSKKLADRLFEQMEERMKGLFGIIHSNKSQSYRFNALKAFQDGEHRVLISTDIMSRGLDIAEVSHVVNFDTPAEPEEYIHRIGRTGRADKDGSSITFVTETEKPFQAAIEKLMNKEITLLDLPEDLEISDKLHEEEKPVKRDKNLAKLARKEALSGAYHEKKAKNKKKQLGGARRQEFKRRLKLKQAKKKGKK